MLEVIAMTAMDLRTPLENYNKRKKLIISTMKSVVFSRIQFERELIISAMEMRELEESARRISRVSPF